LRQDGCQGRTTKKYAGKKNVTESQEAGQKDEPKAIVRVRAIVVTFAQEQAGSAAVRFFGECDFSVGKEDCYSVSSNQRPMSMTLRCTCDKAVRNVASEVNQERQEHEPHDRESPHNQPTT
jgi:hypothetical protein